MKHFTEKIITTAMKEDDEITASRASQALRILKGLEPIAGQVDVEPDQILVSTREAARLLSISRQSLWRLERQGTVKPIVLGCSGGHRIKRYALEALKKLAR